MSHFPKISTLAVQTLAAQEQGAHWAKACAEATRLDIIGDAANRAQGYFHVAAELARLTRILADLQTDPVGVYKFSDHKDGEQAA